MITEAETFKLKNKVLEEIAVLFEAKLRAGEIKDEDEANAIVDFVNEKIDTAIHPRKFTKAVEKFSKKFPIFAQIDKKLRLMRRELLQEIGQECIDNLMDQNPEQWESLSEDLEMRDENTLGEWMNKLPEENHQLFTEKVFNPNAA